MITRKRATTSQQALEDVDDDSADDDYIQSATNSDDDDDECCFDDDLLIVDGDGMEFVNDDILLLKIQYGLIIWVKMQMMDITYREYSKMVKFILIKDGEALNYLLGKFLLVSNI